MTPANEPQTPSNPLDSTPIRIANPPAGARLFVVYNSYRLLVAGCLIALLLIPATRDLVLGIDLPLFLGGCLFLLITAGVMIGPLGRRITDSESGIFGLMLADIIAVALITNASGGILSGFSVLYLVTAAFAAVMLSTRILSALIAAIAALAVLSDTFWRVSSGSAELGMMLPAGILGSLLFAVSLLVQILSQRLAQAEAQADAAESQVIALQQLNQQVILHMRTGILLASEDGRLTPINAAAQRLLNLEPGEQSEIALISRTLASQYEEWLLSQRHRPEPFQVSTDAPLLIASFAAIGEPEVSNRLVFVEDYTPVTQFAQSLKLDSLSKLTASIAHEIRNPLSAIQHSAQLLAESHKVDASDRLLCDILVKNSDRVSDIIDNVTEVSRRQAPKASLIPLNPWLTDWIAEYRTLQGRDDSIELNRSPAEPRVAVDPNHLKRVLSNLVDNALRHSLEDGGKAGARLDIAVDTAANQAYVDVVDFGMGVSEHHKGRLFEPFFTTSDAGTGLGLYLCKELCEINGVGLIYRPTVQHESAFRLSFRLEDTNP